MIIQSKQTTVAYRCPTCGSIVYGMVGVFSLSGDMIKLKCSCGGSEMRINYGADGKIKLTVPCLICPNTHTYTVSRDGFFEKDILVFACTYTGLDTCYIGNKENIDEAVKESNKQLNELLLSAGFEDFSSFMAGKRSVEDVSDNVDSDYRIDYAQIEDVVRFMLSELKEEGSIKCECGNPDCDFDFKGENVVIYCRNCHSEKIIPMSSTLAANAFLHTDVLELEKNNI